MLLSSARVAERHYVCPPPNGCGRTTVVASTVEAVVVGLVVTRTSQRVDGSPAEQRAAIVAVLDRALVAPGSPGARTFDPARVRPVWRS